MKKSFHRTKINRPMSRPAIHPVSRPAIHHPMGVGTPSGINRRPFFRPGVGGRRSGGLTVLIVLLVIFVCCIIVACIAGVYLWSQGLISIPNIG